jgi:hypothetical protein
MKTGDFGRLFFSSDSGTPRRSRSITINTTRSGLDFELRLQSLFDVCRGLAFACDAGAARSTRTR